MAERLSWEEIKAHYDHEWVELVDYDWREEEEYPRAGIVRVHARTRKEFDELAAVDAPPDSAYVYTGRRGSPAGAILNTFRLLVAQ